MPKADSPKPVQLSPADVADLAERFVKHVTDYLRWDEMHRLTAAIRSSSLRMGGRSCAAKADWLLRIEDTSGRKYEAAARIRENGPTLAAGLEFYGLNSSGVLSVAHCVGASGGGPDYVRPEWEQNKVALQRAAIRLRLVCEGTAGIEDSTIPPRARKAHAEYEAAARALDKTAPTDREAYDWVETHNTTDEAGDLPSFATWQRNLREGRRLKGTQKNTARAGRVDLAGRFPTVDDVDPQSLPGRARPRWADG